MKIGIITDTYFPELGGGQVHVMNLARFLKKNNQVEIFTSTKGEDEEIDNILVKRSGAKKDWSRLYFDLLNVFRFIKRFDLVHSHYTYYLSCISGILCKIMSKSFVVTLHGLGTLDSSVNKNLKKKLFRWISFKCADAVIATSEEMAEVAKRFVKEDKINVISNGVDTSYFQPKETVESKEDFIILSARRLNPKNGVQYLVEAIPYIVSKIKNIKFLILGVNHLENYLKKRVGELEVSQYVDFLGEIPNENMLDLYRKADITVFPSSAESTSIACLESMSVGNLIVASSLSAFKEMLGENRRGILVKLFDRETSDYNAPLKLSEDRIINLSNAIIRAIENEDLRNNLIKNARSYVKDNYDWRVIVKKTEEIYKKVL